MPYYFYIWTPEIVAHLAEHGVTPEEFEEIVSNSSFIKLSRSTGNPLSVGLTAEGRRICCIFRWIDADTIEAITAYEVNQ